MLIFFFKKNLFAYSFSVKQKTAAKTNVKAPLLFPSMALSRLSYCVGVSSVCFETRSSAAFLDGLVFTL